MSASTYNYVGYPTRVHLFSPLMSCGLNIFYCSKWKTKGIRQKWSLFTDVISYMADNSVKPIQFLQIAFEEQPSSICNPRQNCFFNFPIFIMRNIMLKYEFTNLIQSVCRQVSPFFQAIRSFATATVSKSLDTSFPHLEVYQWQYITITVACNFITPSPITIS